MRSLRLGAHLLTDTSEAYVIAELGNSHQGDLMTARRMIQKAAQAGASAVKFQARDNARLYSQELLDKPYENENSFGKTYGEHRAALELSPQDLNRCFIEAHAHHIEGFATAFDEYSADRLMGMSVPAIKLASGALTDSALQKHVASFQIPILLSTGGGSDVDVDRAVQTLSAFHPNFALLHCTAAYPTDPKDANLRCILTFRSRYPDTIIGYSSHFPGIMWSLVAYSFGAAILEHHFTLDRSMKGTDHAFSLEPKGLQTLVEDLKKLHLGLGSGVKRFLPAEQGPIAKMRRVKTEHGLQITGKLDASA